MAQIIDNSSGQSPRGVEAKLFRIGDGLDYGFYALATKSAQGIEGIAYMLKSDNHLGIFDTGVDKNLWNLEKLATVGLGPGNFESTKIFLTHGHYDHTAAANYLRESYNAQVLKSGVGLTAENFFPHPEYKQELLYAGFPAEEMGVNFEPFKVDKIVKEGDVIKIGNIDVAVLEIPGHSKDGVCYAFDAGKGLYLIVGDTISTNIGEIPNLDLMGTNTVQITKSFKKVMQYVEEKGKVIENENGNIQEKGKIFGVFAGHDLMHDFENNQDRFLNTFRKITTENLKILYSILDTAFVSGGFQEFGKIAPPNEHEGITLRITRGCEWNKCSFCSIYEGDKFSVRKKEELLQEIENIAEFYKETDRNVKTVFLQDANALIMRTDDLEEILLKLKSSFPNIERITSYSSSRNLSKKKIEDLVRLREAGLTRVHVGLESGNNKLLEIVRKQATAEKHIEAARKAKAAGIELSHYVILALGGKDYSEEHARDTAFVLNESGSDFVRFRSYMDPREELMLGNPLMGWKMLEEGRKLPFIGYKEMTDPEQVIELKTILENLTINTEITSDHHSNVLLDVQGKFPQDREKIFATIDKYLSLSIKDQIIFRIGKELDLFMRVEDFGKANGRFYKKIEEGYMRSLSEGCPTLLKTAKNTGQRVKFETAKEAMGGFGGLGSLLGLF